MTTLAILAESLGAVVIRHDVRRGVSVARNAAIARASGEFIALLDADDVWEVDKLARQLTAMRAAPTAELCTAHFRYFLHPGVAAPSAFDPATEGDPPAENVPQHMVNQTRRLPEVRLLQGRPAGSGGHRLVLNAASLPGRKSSRWMSAS